MFRLEESTIADMSRAMEAAEISSRELALCYLRRIAALDRAGPCLRSLIELNPDALAIADALDRERALGRVRGPLHGIPVVLKDNIDTGDRMHTSAGTLALAGSYARRDAALAARLRAAGAVILAKANMTELANFMAKDMPGGYSSRGGQVLNPYGPGRLDPGGSSSGSAVAAAANLCAAAVGTETSGSILSPASANAVVGIKPTLGLVSRSGIVPISYSQDTAGPIARTVADAAALLGGISGPDVRDPATAAAEGLIPQDYTSSCVGGGLAGARIGVPRLVFFDRIASGQGTLVDEMIAALRDQGAVVVDPAEVPTAAQVARSDVMLYEFKSALNAYLAELGPTAPVRSLADLIAFNRAHKRRCLRYGQTTLVRAERLTSGSLLEPEYIEARLSDLRLCRTHGLDAVFEAHRLDAVLFPGIEGCAMAARAGYPSVTVPAGFWGSPRGRAPYSVTLTGPAWSEPRLIRLAFGLEQATRRREPPKLADIS
jgi:amidase